MDIVNGKIDDVSVIEESIDITAIYKSVTDRYYTRRYCINVGGDQEDHCVLFHSNRICLVTLAKSHPILKNQKKIVKIDFQVSTNVDRMKNKVSGKGKHGAQCLQMNSALCFIECEDGNKYTVRSCVKGKLVEMNDNLIENPVLLLTKPFSEGYIAIVLPNISSSEQQKKELLSQEEYEDVLNERCENLKKSLCLTDVDSEENML